MTMPFLSPAFRYLKRTACTDVADLITDLRAELVTNGSPAWTEPATAKFESPHDSDGRYYSAEFIRTSATILRQKVRDKGGTIIGDDALYIDSAGTDVHIATGTFHTSLTAMRSTPEDLMSGILDLSPEAQTCAEGSYTYGRGNRIGSSDTDQSYSSWGVFGLNAGSMWGAYRAYRLMSLQLITEGYNWYNNVKTPAGSPIVIPAMLYGILSGVPRIIGQMYQHWVIHNDSDAIGTTPSLPIDDTNTAHFLVTGMPASTLVNGYVKCRLAVRID